MGTRHIRSGQREEHCMSSVCRLIVDLDSSRASSAAGGRDEGLAFETFIGCSW